MQELTRPELIRARNKCDESLLFFTRFFFKHLNGAKFIVSCHHRDICKNLERVETYDLDLLNINIPPRFSKTELAAVNFIARGVGMNPNANYLYITASDELRSQTSVSIRDIVSHPYFKIMYGTELKKDQNGKNLWRTTQGGGLKTATIGGQITGFGAGQMIDHADLVDEIRTFEGCIVLDDINKTDDSETENANNDKVSRVVFNTIMSRKNSRDTPIINIQQRAGMSDVTSQFMDHYKENDRAEFMVMPVITDGIPLWEWKHNIEDIDELKNSPKTKHIFETQYMQNPIPKEGLCFPKADMLYYDKLPEPDKWEISLAYGDPADAGLDNHSMPFAVISGGFFYVSDVIFTQDNLTAVKPRVISKLNQWKTDQAFIEANNHGAPYIRDLRELVDIQIGAIKNTTQKAFRIIAQEGFINLHFKFKRNVNADSEYDKFMRQVWRFTRDGKYKKDDAPDSLAGLSFIIRRNFGYFFNKE